MVRPTDGGDDAGYDDHTGHDDPHDHPDLRGVAAEMRAEWRAEQESAVADAAAQRRHDRSLGGWLSERMHAGDRVAVTVAGRPFVGPVEEVGDDLLVLRTASGRVEIHVCAGIPIELAVVEHAKRGGMRGPWRRGFRDALLARDGQRDVTVGTLARPDGIGGTLLAGRDFVSVVTPDGAETIVPIAHVAWVTANRR